MPIDYESWGFKTQLGYKTPVMEGFRGVQLVSWYHAIQRKLEEMITDYEEDGNRQVVTALTQFLSTWKDNKITGSVNVEDIRTLQAASDQMSASIPQLKSFFQPLSANLDIITASEEELPRDYDEEAMPKPKKSGKPSTQFGGTDTPPKDLGAEPNLDAAAAEPAPEPAPVA